MIPALPRLRPAPWILLAALACGHEDPVEPGSGGASGPLVPGYPTRLTFSPRYESTPFWLPDGSGVLHSFDRILSEQFDRCLGVLPGGGGSRNYEFCATSAGSVDSLDALEGAGVSPGGRLLYQWSRSAGTRVSPTWGALVLATLAQPWDTLALTLVPYTLPGGRVHGRIARVDWLDEERAVYLGEEVLYPRACSNCTPDTVRIGREGVLVNLAGATPSLAIIPGTEDATSLAAAPGSAFLYLTRPLDARVYRLPVAGGVPEQVYDFGALGVARDVALAGDRLYVIVGGNVTQVTVPELGTWQSDEGGRLFVLDLGGGGAAEIPILASLLLRRPSADPTGGPGVAVEGYELAVLRDVQGNVLDSIVSRVPDLWQYDRQSAVPLPEAP